MDYAHERKLKGPYAEIGKLNAELSWSRNGFSYACATCISPASAQAPI